MRANEFEECLRNYGVHREPCFRNITFCDAPDGYVLSADGKTATIYEHFRVSSSESGKKGSKIRQEQSSLRKKAEKNLESFEQESKSTFSKENLAKDFERNYKNHYGKIEKYKDNLVTKGVANKETKFFICFVIEMHQIMPIVGRVGGVIRFLSISDVKKCLQTMIDFSVDLVMVLSGYGRNNLEVEILTKDEIVKKLSEPDDLIEAGTMGKVIYGSMYLGSKPHR